MRFLTCEPNFNKQVNYLDEADQFFANPASWIGSHFPVYPKSALPSHVILFDNLQPKISKFLSSYKQIHQIFHSDANFVTERVGANVLVFERATESVENVQSDWKEEEPSQGSGSQPIATQDDVEL